MQGAEYSSDVPADSTDGRSGGGSGGGGRSSAGRQTLRGPAPPYAPGSTPPSSFNNRPETRPGPVERPPSSRSVPVASPAPGASPESPSPPRPRFVVPDQRAGPTVVQQQPEYLQTPSLYTEEFPFTFMHKDMEHENDLVSLCTSYVRSICTSKCVVSKSLRG